MIFTPINEEKGKRWATARLEAIHAFALRGYSGRHSRQGQLLAAILNWCVTKGEPFTLWGSPGGYYVRKGHAPEHAMKWSPMSEAPKTRPILARGESGYIAPMDVRYAVIQWCEYEKDPESSYEFKTTGATGRWDGIGGDRVTDDGPMPTEWTEVPQ